MDVQRVLVDDNARPDAAHEVFLGQQLAGRQQKLLENIEGTAAERRHGAVGA